MKTYTTTVIEMTSEELAERFKKFVKENTGYEGEVRVGFDSDDEGEILVEVIMNLTDDQECKLEEAGVCPMPPAIGYDLLYQIYGDDVRNFEFGDTENEIRITIFK